MSALPPTALWLTCTALALGGGYLFGRWRRHSDRRSASAGHLARDAFLANLAHELRTPLSAMLGYAEIAAEEQDPEQEPDRRQVARRNEFSGRVLEQGRQLQRLVNDLFDYARLREGRLAVHPIPCEPRAVVRGLEQELRAETDRKGLLLAVAVDERVPMRVECDPDRLGQVLAALLHNAVKFTRRGSVRLDVGAAAGGRRLVCTIQDSGPGIPEAVRDPLFDGLGQGDDGPDRRHGGIGLGLAFAQALVERLGGGFEVLESGPETGTTLRVTLPVRPASGGDPVLAPVKPRSVPRPAADSSGKPAPAQASGRVLVVDDAADNRLLLGHALGKLGLHTETAENGLVALRTLDRQRFDCVVMDLQMPVLDGYATLRSLRDRDDHTPVIALTAHALDGERERCLEAGFDAFLTKPLDREQLAEALNRVLAASHG